MKRTLQVGVLVLFLGAWTFAGGVDAADVVDASSQPTPPVDSRAMAKRVDDLLADLWKNNSITPAAAATDSEFVRRAYLDLNGVIPRVGDVRAYLADTSPNKRVELVDRLLASPRYSTHMATVWRNRILPLGVDPQRGPQAVALQKWLRTRFAKNLRYDNLVGEMLLTLGGDELGPALYFQVNDVSPEKLATNTAELFLGLHLQCAQCHDHPTAAWKQRDFWGLAAFFARVRMPDERVGMMRVAPRLVDTDQGDVRLPESSEIVPAKYPGGEVTADDPQRSRRLQLALWLTSRENKYFAKAAANWAWAQLFGRGLVESLDDQSATDPRDQLLAELADYFINSNYDLKSLWRTLATTRAYALSSRAADAAANTAAEPEHFQRMLAKPLTPEQLYDSFAVLAPIEAEVSYGSESEGSEINSSLLENPARTDFIRRMRPPPGKPTEYRAGTLQALLLMNGRATAGVTSVERPGIVGALDAPYLTDENRVQSLFLATLAREPSDDESQACLASLKEAGESGRSQALSDVLWALVNSTEFAFNK